MDSYYHVEKNKKYLAVYVTTGMNDARVPYWHSAKFVAKMQAYNKSDKPILFSVDFEGGHGSQADMDKIY